MSQKRIAGVCLLRPKIDSPCSGTCWTILTGVLNTLADCGRRGVGRSPSPKVIRLHPEADVISVNCASPSGDVADSRLFGIAKKNSAWPAALVRAGKQGYVGAADGRLLFLDEFFEAPPSISATKAPAPATTAAHVPAGWQHKDISLDEKTVIVAATIATQRFLN